MRILVDTHIFLWLSDSSHLLSSSAKEILSDPNNSRVLSVVSVWEMQIKVAIGKLPLRLPLADLVREQRQKNGFEILPVTLEHVLALETLPTHHKDPFDRLLIAQSQSENLPLLSADAVFERYAINRLN